MTKLQLWVKTPKPGQFRGEGEWELFTQSDDAWASLIWSGWLPTHEGEKPNE